MSETIALQAIPKQQFTIVLAGVLYNLAFKETNGCMSFDCTRGGEVIAQGQRIVAGVPLLPYDRLQDGEGNFVMLTQNGQLPYYTAFESTQTLVYVTQAEIDLIDGADDPKPRNFHAGAGNAVGVAIVSGVGAHH